MKIQVHTGAATMSAVALRCTRLSRPNASAAATPHVGFGMSTIPDFDTLPPFYKAFAHPPHAAASFVSFHPCVAYKGFAGCVPTGSILAIYNGSKVILQLVTLPILSMPRRSGGRALRHWRDQNGTCLDSAIPRTRCTRTSASLRRTKRLLDSSARTPSP